MTVCKCPAAAALPNIPNMSCGENFGQIQKIAFQRLFNAGKKNSFKGEAPITALASWQTVLGGKDDTKVVVTPFVQAPTQEGGDPITFGGGNETLGGMEMIIGSNPTTLTVALREFPQSIIAALKELACERNLGVYLFNERGQIEALHDGDEYFPIPIRNLYIGDKIHGGFDTPDMNSMKFSLPAGYSDKLEIVTPTDFNPLLDLVNAAE